MRSLSSNTKKLLSTMTSNCILAATAFIVHRAVMIARRAPIAAPNEATALTAAPVNGVVLLLGETAPVPEAEGAEGEGAAAAVVVGWKRPRSAIFPVLGTFHGNSRHLVQEAESMQIH